MCPLAGSAWFAVGSAPATVVRWCVDWIVFSGPVYIFHTFRFYIDYSAIFGLKLNKFYKPVFIRLIKEIDNYENKTQFFDLFLKLGPAFYVSFSYFGFCPGG